LHPGDAGSAFFLLLARFNGLLHPCLKARSSGLRKRKWNIYPSPRMNPGAILMNGLSHTIDLQSPAKTKLSYQTMLIN
ncbi:MAG: hypothetical protein K9G47_06980, partial [Bacteroidales bacterium]|nr:hypothetical protein [Bacteroidales bacterium]